MTLDNLRKKVIYQNTLDIWIGACEEKNIHWNSPENYKKFIDYLQNQNLSMKKFSLCMSESDQTSEFTKAKAKLAEFLSESKDSNSATYTVRLNDSTIELIRKFDLIN